MDCLNTSGWENCDTTYQIYIRCMYIYILTGMIGLGLLGNVLTLLVFTIQKRERRNNKSSTTDFLICLAIADSLYLITNIFSRVLPTMSKYIYFGEKLTWSLQIRTYSTVWAGVSQGFAALMVLAVTLQIYLTTTELFKANTLTSKKKFLFAGILLFSVLYKPP